MIVFESISIKNFMSFGAVPTIIPLNQPGTTLVVGENLDDTADGEGSNGCGKTTIVNALTYALFDKPLTEVEGIDDLVNNINNKDMEVILLFQKDNQQYKIRRVRKEKKGAGGNYVHFFNGSDDLTVDVAGTNKLIEEVLGMPYDLFVRIVAFSAMHTPFLRLKPTPQSDIMEELFDLKLLTDKAAVLKTVISDTKASIDTHTAHVASIEKEKDRHDIQLDNAHKRVNKWMVDTEAAIESLQEKLQKVDGIDVEAERKNQEELIEIRSLERQLKRDLREELTAIGTLESDIKDREEEINSLENAECPYCKQSFTVEKDELQQLKDTQSTTEREVDSHTTNAADLDDQAMKLADDVIVLERAIGGRDIDELIDIASKATLYHAQIDELAVATNPHVEAVDELNNIVFDKGDTEKLNELIELQEHHKFLQKLLTRKDSFIRKALLKKNMHYLNQRLGYYLTELGLPHIVEFTQELTAQISYFGRKIRFGGLSSGQQARVNIALSFAFRDVLQELHGSINICMLDEVLDVGLDSIGIKKAARMLQNEAKRTDVSLWVISHKTEIDNVFDKKITVQLIDGFSNVLYGGYNV